MSNKYQETIYNLVHLNKARGEVFINHKQLQQDIDILWELYNKYDELTKTLTLEEVKKEWEEKGFEVENNDKSISFRNTKLNIDIYVDKISKEVQICVCHYNYAQPISFEFHNLLSKTLKTLEVEDDR